MKKPMLKSLALAAAEARKLPVLKPLALAAALGAGLSAFAANVATTISEPTTLTEKQAYESAEHWNPLYINADLTVDGGKLYENWAGKVYLPNLADTTASLVLTNGGQVEFYWPVSQHASGIYIGQNGGKGRIVLADRSNAVLNHIWVAANAEADESGYVDFMTLGSTNNTMKITDIVVDSATPARVVFMPGNAGLRPSQNINTSGSTEVFKPSAGKRLVLWANEGAAIRAHLFMDNAQGIVAAMQMNSGEGVVETAGPGSFVASASAEIKDGQCLYLNGGPDKVVWNHAGDTIISNGVTAVVTVDNALPCGSQTGDFVLSTDPWNRSGLLDLAGHVAGVNGLRASGNLAQYGGGVTNSSETVAVLEFGRGGTDGVCEITNVYDNITFRKVGGGTLTVRNTWVDTLEVTDGICRIGEGVKVGHVRVTGGFLELEVGATLDCSDVTYSGSGAFRRATSGDAATLSGGANLTDPLHVASGTLTVYDSDRDNKFWRLVIRGVHTSNTYAHKIWDETTSAWSDETQDVYAALNRFYLYSYEEGKSTEASRLNANLTEAAVGTAATDLEPGQIASAKSYLTGMYNFGIQQQSVGAAQTTAPGSSQWAQNISWANAVPTKNDPATWETLTMRLKDGTAPVASFIYVHSFYNPPAGNPTAINVECSADGTEWVVKYANDAMGNRHWQHPAQFYQIDVTAMTANPHGAFNTCPSVEVAAGATLDLSGIPSENVLFTGLAIDLDRGAGTISYFVPAATGNIYLRTANALVYGVMEKGPTFTTVGGTPKNVKKWKVYVNGVENDRLVVTVTSDGRLNLTERKGALFIIR